MAGNYPNVPSWRVPWHKDGSVLLGNNSEQGSGTKNAVNSMGAAYQMGVDYGAGMTWVLIFPRLMDIDGWLVGSSTGGSYGSGGSGNAWSPNTTNGVDGNWYAWSGGNVGGQGHEGCRLYITSGTIGGVRAVRGSYSGGTGGAWLHHVHIYGEPTSGEDTNKVQVWHPTLNRRLNPAEWDLGDIQRGTTQDYTFRVKNLSSSLTANSIRLSFSVPNDASPTVPAQYQVSDDGTTFYAQRTITSLAPGAISSVYTMRRTIPSNAQLSTWTILMDAEPLTWS